MRFLDALKKRKEEGGIPFIPDIKCYSPKDGDLMRGRDPAAIAKQLEEAGACAVSVVTEEKEFHGSMDLLRKVCGSVSIPVLRKDFITCEKDLDETKAAGADAILLMVSCLGEEKLEELYHAALQRGLLPFVETHTQAELSFAGRLKAPLTGINNRNILMLEKDDGTVEHAGNLLQHVSGTESFMVVESGLQNADDVRFAIHSGADAVLVGTAVLNAKDPVTQFRKMTRKCGVKICGLMSREDVDACLRQAVDICGFVAEYPVDVRWNLDRNEAAGLIKYAREKSREMFGACGPKICVVTGGAPEKILALARELKPDYIQMHYRETLEMTEQTARELEKTGISVIRSVPGEAGARTEMFGTANLTQIVQQLLKTPVKGILLDSRYSGNAASGGGSILDVLEPETADIHNQLKGSGKILLIGGGITPAVCDQAIKALHPDYIDVMTGAEAADGSKSENLIRQLIDRSR